MCVDLTVIPPAAWAPLFNTTTCAIIVYSYVMVRAGDGGMFVCFGGFFWGGLAIWENVVHSQCIRRSFVKKCPRIFSAYAVDLNEKAIAFSG